METKQAVFNESKRAVILQTYNNNTHKAREFSRASLLTARFKHSSISRGKLRSEHQLRARFRRTEVGLVPLTHRCDPKIHGFGEGREKFNHSSGLMTCVRYVFFKQSHTARYECYTFQTQQDVQQQTI